MSRRYVIPSPPAFDARGNVRSVQAGDVQAGESALLNFYTNVKDIRRAMNTSVKIYPLSIARNPCVPNQCYHATAAIQLRKVDEDTLREGGEVQERACIPCIALDSSTGP